MISRRYLSILVHFPRTIPLKVHTFWDMVRGKRALSSYHTTESAHFPDWLAESDWPVILQQNSDKTGHFCRFRIIFIYQFICTGMICINWLLSVFHTQENVTFQDMVRGKWSLSMCHTQKNVFSFKMWKNCLDYCKTWKTCHWKIWSWVISTT